MSWTTHLTIAYTPDSDDALYYFALETGRSRLPGFLPEFVTRHIRDLNRAALTGKYDVTAISSVAYPAVADRYAILSVGTSVGRGYGPVLVGRRFAALDELRGRHVGVPGLSSTGCFLLRHFCPRAVPVEMAFDRIGAAVAAGELDAGVMIHEELLAFPRLGLHRISDLGAEWCRRYELPLPVGLNVIRRDLGRSTMESVAQAIRRSLEYGLRHPKPAFAWLRSRGHISACTEEFVSMFANRDSLHLPADARVGLRVLLGQAAELTGNPVPPLDIVDGAASTALATARGT
jgi:1,4-dihydroxy-6-naphthoate synthase